MHMANRYTAIPVVSAWRLPQSTPKIADKAADDADNADYYIRVIRGFVRFWLIERGQEKTR
jgi:hypothetical protein